MAKEGIIINNLIKDRDMMLKLIEELRNQRRYESSKERIKERKDTRNNTTKDNTTKDNTTKDNTRKDNTTKDNTRKDNTTKDNTTKDNARRR